MAANHSPDKPQVFRSPTAVIVWIVWLLFAVGNWVDLAVQGGDHASAVAAAILLLATGAVYVTAQRPRIIADETGVTVRNPLRDHRIGWASVAKVDLADMLRVHCEWAGPAGSAPGAPGGKEQRKLIAAWAIHYSRRRQFAAEARARRPARAPGLRRSSLGLESGGRGLPYGASGPASEASSAMADAEKIVRVLSERATAARAKAVWAGDPAEAAGAEAARRTGTAPGTGTGTAPGTGTGTAARTGTAGETRAAAGTGTEAAARTEAASPAGRTTALDAASRPGGSEPLKSTWSGRAIAALVIPALILLVVWLL